MTVVAALILAATGGAGLGSFAAWLALVRPAARPGTTPHGDPRDGELAALRLRVQVADALAEQERLRAAQSGAGTAALLAGLLAAEEGTRGQLAAELHDTVAQSLLLARSQLAGMAEEAGGTGPAGAGAAARCHDVARVAELVAETEEQLRGVIARTRPPALRDGDLGSAVELLCDDFAHRYGLVVAVSWPPLPVPVPMTVAVPTYRFLAEALLNVVKHADGDHAEAALSVQQGWLCAEVSDGGPGFDPAQVRPRAGRQVGLDLLAARVALGGGMLRVHSAPGQPTTVRLRLPLPLDMPHSPAVSGVPAHQRLVSGSASIGPDGAAA